MDKRPKVHLHFTKNTWCTITSEIPSALNAVLSDHFSRFVPSAKYSEAYKNHIRKVRGQQVVKGVRTWDGYKRFYDRDKKCLRMGLAKDLIALLTKNHFEFEITYDDETAKYFKHKIEPVVLESEYELREWQKIAYDTVVSRKRGLVCSPTATGKTVVISSVVNALLNAGMRVLILTERINLAVQTKRELSAHGIPEKRIGVLCCKTDDEESDVTIITVQSMEQIKDFKTYDALIVDESHHAKADTYKTICRKCTNAWFRVGFSATFPKEGSIDMLEITGLIGPVIYEGEYDYHIELGEISEPTIYFVDYMDNEGPDFEEKGEYHVMEDKHIVNNDQRNKLIVKIAKEVLDRGKRVLLLSSRIDLGLKIASALGTDYIYGSTSLKERDELVNDFQNGRSQLLVASSEVMGEGIDLKGGCDCLISTGSAASYIKVLQQIGRSMRKNTSMKVSVIDFIDRGHTYFFEHSKERIKVCAKKFGKGRIRIIKKRLE